ncbi:hypothetical protein ACI2JA_08615 [Alkalihalobacillus sp. NPDC078783]
MKRITTLASMISVTFIIAGCQTTDGESNSQVSETVESDPGENEDISEEVNEGDTNGGSDSESKEDEEESSNDNQNIENLDREEDEDSSSSKEENNKKTYSGTQESINYFIDSHLFNHESDFYTAFTINRGGEGKDYSIEERLKQSLIENDPTEQKILDSFTDMSLDWPELKITFNAEETELSTTPGVRTLFFDSLLGISDLYGIEQIIFLNSDGENDVTVTERLVDEPIAVENERGLSRGYYTIYDDELEQTLFISGSALEDEDVVDENGEALTFKDTVEVMRSINSSEAFYSSAIVDGIEIIDASIVNGVASVQYTMDEDLVTEADRTVFENAIQLAALDFHAWEVDLVNDTLQEGITYPLVGQ